MKINLFTILAITASVHAQQSIDPNNEWEFTPLAPTDGNSLIPWVSNAATGNAGDKPQLATISELLETLGDLTTVSDTDTLNFTLSDFDITADVNVSGDAANALTFGTDGALFVPSSIDTWVDTFVVGSQVPYVADALDQIRIPINQTTQGAAATNPEDLIIQLPPENTVSLVAGSDDCHDGLAQSNGTPTIDIAKDNIVLGDDNDSESTATNTEIVDIKFSGQNTAANGGVTLPTTETRGTGSHFVKPKLVDNGDCGIEVITEMGVRRTNTNFYDPEFYSDTPLQQREDQRFIDWSIRGTSMIDGVEKFYGGRHDVFLQTRPNAVSSLVLDMNELHSQNEDLVIEGNGKYHIVGKADVFGSVRFRRASRVHAEFGDIDTNGPNASSRTIGSDASGSFSFREFFIEADETTGILTSQRSKAHFDVKNHIGLMRLNSQSGPSEVEGTSISVNFEKASNLVGGSYSTAFSAISISTSSTDSAGAAQGETPSVTSRFNGNLVEADVNGTGVFSSANFGVINVTRSIGFSNGNALDADGNEITIPVADPIALRLPDVWSTFEIDNIYNRIGRNGSVISVGQWARARYNNSRIIQENPSTDPNSTMLRSHGASNQVNDLVFVGCEFLSDDALTTFINSESTNVTRIWLMNCRGNIPLNQIGGGRVIINGVSDVSGIGSHTIGTGPTDVKPWEYTFDPTLNK